MPPDSGYGDIDGPPRRRGVAEDSESHSRRRGGSDEFSPTEIDKVRQLAREQIERAWEEIGVEFGTFKGRQEHAQLLQWIRDRKVMREAGASKVLTATIGAAVSALFAAALTYLSGRHT